MVTDLRCSGSFGYRSNAVLAKGGHSLHLFPEQTASASQPGDFLGGCGHGRYHDHAGSCSGPADGRGQAP